MLSSLLTSGGRISTRTVCRATGGVAEVRHFSRRAPGRRGTAAPRAKGETPQPMGVHRVKMLKPVEGEDAKKLKKAKTKKEMEKEAQSVTYGFGRGGRLFKVPPWERAQNSKLVNAIGDSLESLKLLPTVRTAMRTDVERNSPRFHPLAAEDAEKEVHATPVQTAAIKLIQGRRSVADELKTFMIAAETGSGKTWAYLAPVIHQLLQEMEENPRWDRMAVAPIIRSVILVPTTVLAQQLMETLEVIAEVTGLHVCSLDMKTETQFREFRDEHLQKRIDVLVTTPVRFDMLYNKQKGFPEKRIAFPSIRHLVIDEADTLLDESWFPVTFKGIRHCPNLRNLIFCSATIPADFQKTLARHFPNAVNITTPRLHKISKRISVEILDCAQKPYNNSKKKGLVQALYAIYHDGVNVGYEKRVIVFMNHVDGVPEMAKYLEGYGHEVYALTGHTGEEERAEIVAQFTSTLKYAGPDEKIRMKVLVTTDLMSRGINFRWVKDVIIYDVPHTAVDLVHRVGRTGRMMTRGRVFLLTTKKENKSWLRGLPSAVKRGIPLS